MPQNDKRENQKREDLQRLRFELDYAVCGGRPTEIAIARTAYRNARRQMVEADSKCDGR
jgi:hypothetical protein